MGKYISMLSLYFLAICIALLLWFILPFMVFAVIGIIAAFITPLLALTDTLSGEVDDHMQKISKESK